MRHSEIQIKASFLKWRRLRVITRMWLRHKANQRYRIIEARHRSMRMVREMRNQGYFS